jgi:ribulose-phosphate 3-epimerase
VISVHPEAGPHLHRTLRRIRDLGARAGVVLNPGTPVEVVDPVLEETDLILVMSVNPGFGGQSFIEAQLRKIERLRRTIDAAGAEIVLEVDGGVTPEIARRCVEAAPRPSSPARRRSEAGATQYAANIAALRGG